MSDAMKDILILLGFVLLAFGGWLLYRGYEKIYRRFSAPLPGQRRSPVPWLLTGFSLATVFFLMILTFTAILVDLPLTVGSVVMAGLMILVFDNALIFVGYLYSQQLNRRDLSNRLMREKQKTEVRYYRGLEEQYNRQRVLIHDMRKHLATIRDLAETSSDRAVSQYVEELERSPALQNRVRICGNQILDVILSRYGEICQKKSISFTADVRDGSVDFLEPIELTALFGNLLENAVEAAQDAEGAFIECAAGTRPGSALVVSVVNACASPPKSDGQGGFASLKTDRECHGLGMKSIREIVKKYGGTLQQYYDEGTGQFHTVILLK